MTDEELDKLLSKMAKEYTVEKCTMKEIEYIIARADKVKRRKNICKIAAVLIVFFICASALLLINNKAPDNYTANGNEEANKSIYEITKIYNESEIFYFGDEEINAIVKIKVKEINDNGIKQGVPNTTFVAEVVEVYEGNVEKEITVSIEESIDVNTNPITRYVSNDDYLQLPYPEADKIYVISLRKSGDIYYLVESANTPFYEINI